MDTLKTICLRKIAETPGFDIVVDMLREEVRKEDYKTYYISLEHHGDESFIISRSGGNFWCGSDICYHTCHDEAGRIIEGECGWKDRYLFTHEVQGSQEVRIPSYCVE